jgi:hypothetical protein
MSKSGTNVRASSTHQNRKQKYEQGSEKASFPSYSSPFRSSGNGVIFCCSSAPGADNHGKGSKSLFGICLAENSARTRDWRRYCYKSNAHKTDERHSILAVIKHSCSRYTWHLFRLHWFHYDPSMHASVSRRDIVPWGFTNKLVTTIKIPMLSRCLARLKPL